MSLYTLLFIGTTPLGSLFIGSLAERWSVPVALVAASGLCAAGVVAGLLYARRRMTSFTTALDRSAA